MSRKVIKTGDYVEVLPGAGNAGIKDGEQGVVVNGDNQNSLEVIFMAGHSCWSKDDGWPWLVKAYEVKLVYQPRFEAE